jgi:predicted O-methyltransferase YrrM
MPRFELPDWFSRHIPNWTTWLAPYVGKDVRALEIGSCEGRSALWLLDNVLTEARATLWCVDPFEEEGFVEGSSPISAERACQNFRENMGGRCVWLRWRSFDFLITKPRLDYDIVYIDGCHKAQNVLEDIVLTWPMLNVGGTLILDDFTWVAPSERDVDAPGIAIHAFLQIYAGQYEVLGIRDQVAVRKIR